MSGQLVAGFIGLGDIGRPMAERIAETGIPLRVWARRETSLEGLLRPGVESCPSPRALGALCDVVGLCVRTDEEVLDVALREPDGLLGGMRAGSILLVHATVLPETVIQLAEAGRRVGVHVLDAPVSGGAKGAAAGTLTVLLGGDAEAIAHARSVLDCFAVNLPHVGGVGAAQQLKLVNNNLCLANVAMGLAAIELLGHLGVDPVMGASVIATSSGASHGLELILNPRTVAKMSGPTSNIRKDVTHLFDLLDALGVESPLTAVSATTADRVAAYVAAGAPATP
jgi:3-hydroxyisobutyrate dehydrogenase-like beta-hydroxyacid dehydrogenase